MDTQGERDSMLTKELDLNLICAISIRTKQLFDVRHPRPLRCCDANFGLEITSGCSSEGVWRIGNDKTPA